MIYPRIDDLVPITGSTVHQIHRALWEKLGFGREMIYKCLISCIYVNLLDGTTFWG